MPDCDVIERIEQRWEEERERWMSRDVEMRDFLDAITRRHVMVTQEAIGALQMLQSEIQEQRQVFRTEMADQRGQLKANTQALLRALDERFGPEPPQG